MYTLKLTAICHNVNFNKIYALLVHNLWHLEGLFVLVLGAESCTWLHHHFYDKCKTNINIFVNLAELVDFACWLSCIGKGCPSACAAGLFNSIKKKKHLGFSLVWIENSWQIHIEKQRESICLTGCGKTFWLHFVKGYLLYKGIETWWMVIKKNTYFIKNIYLSILNSIVFFSYYWKLSKLLLNKKLWNGTKQHNSGCIKPPKSQSGRRQQLKSVCTD